MSWASDEFPRIRARLMAAAMQPIERQAAEATVEIVELESWLNDEVKCESPHTRSKCTEEVTHRAWGCNTGWRNICQSAAAIDARIIAADVTVCAGCEKAPRDCWLLVPA